MSGPALVYHAGGLGDFVLSLPAIIRAVQHFGAEGWHLWGPPERLALLPGFAPAPTELTRSGHTLWGDEPAPQALHFLRECRAVVAFGGRRPPAWAGLAGDAALAVASFPPAGGPWVPRHHAQQLDGLGVPRPRAPWLPAWRRHVLPDPSPSEIVLHPGSGDPKKNLPASTWVETLRVLRRELDLPVRLVLGPAEQERGGWGELAGVSDAVSVCTTIGELLGVLGRSALFLGNDSGASHLAAILGIPTVAVFGPSAPALWRPLGPRVRAVTAGAACSPCTDGGPIACPGPRCTAEVRVADLVEAAKGVLRAGPAAVR
ncbi:MAG: glycosyltransferase family 9 protein [Deltaproteobacteria bacterium]|nr:glycosyltransferase family 9 protein [Deltaproteobacteria bacterium]